MGDMDNGIGSMGGDDMVIIGMENSVREVTRIERIMPEGSNGK